MNATELTPELAALVNAARTLPAMLVRQVAEYAIFLTSKHGEVSDSEQSSSMDEAYDWTDEELEQVTIAALRQFEAEHPDENWGVDYTANGGQHCSPPAT